MQKILLCLPITLSFHDVIDLMKSMYLWDMNYAYSFNINQVDEGL